MDGGGAHERGRFRSVFATRGGTHHIDTECERARGKDDANVASAEQALDEVAIGLRHVLVVHTDTATQRALEEVILAPLKDRKMKENKKENERAIE